MKPEKKTCYEVVGYYKDVHRGKGDKGVFYKLEEKRTTIENGIATFDLYDNIPGRSVVLASALAWTPEEAFALHTAKKLVAVETAKRDLEDAEKELAESRLAYEKWQKQKREEEEFKPVDSSTSWAMKE